MPNKRKKKVLVAMSGGVDSSVAAALLKQRGYQVIGCFMRLGDHTEEDAENDDTPTSCAPLPPGKAHHQGCCSVNDASDARLVAAMLDIPFYVLNFKKDFDRIIDYFVTEYNAGRTPNPCVRCNDWLKFGKLAAYSRTIEADFVATGHYARVEHSQTGPARLLRGLDLLKDQSYVLFGTPLEQLSHMLLPIGDLEKSQVREVARQLKLPVFNKPDSQEICFVPNNDYVTVIHNRTPDKIVSGQIQDVQGRTIGHHDGHQQFTIGQRRGLSVSLGHPIYVLDKNPVANTVTVGTKDDLLAQGLKATQTNWLVPVATRRPKRCGIKIRYNSAPVPGEVVATGKDALQARFDQPQLAVTPGQAVVCYDDHQVICGGWITTAVRQESSSARDD